MENRFIEKLRRLVAFDSGDIAELDAMMERHRAVAQAMYISQLIDEGTMRAWITSVGRRTSIERVAHLMCELYLRARNIGLASAPPFALPLSQLLLADALGMTPVHLNRVLKESRLGGAMDIHRGSLMIVDPAKLIQIAGFDENYLHRRTRQGGVNGSPAFVVARRHDRPRRRA